LLRIANIAPIGHAERQNGRLIKINATRNAINIQILGDFKSPKITLSSLGTAKFAASCAVLVAVFTFVSVGTIVSSNVSAGIGAVLVVVTGVAEGGIRTAGSVASNVPAGHKLQKKKRWIVVLPGVTVIPKNIGMKRTIIRRVAYLPYFRNEGRLILEEGILYNKSCKNPKGHTQPQSIRPMIAPKKMIIPNTINGKTPAAKNCPIAPIGQLNAAIGQPQHFRTGKHICLKEKKYGLSKNTNKP
jgi:hypothetical protein